MLERARGSDRIAARALMAFHRGEDSKEATIGGMLVAEGLRSLRTLSTFVTLLDKKGR